MTLFVILALPLAAAALCWFVRDRRVAPVATLVSSLGVLALTLEVVFSVLAQGQVVAIPNAIATDALGA